MLESAVGIKDARVLDLYAGTGALGIEALSRGARWADFVEYDEKACAVIRENLWLTHLDGCGRVVRARVERIISEAAGVGGDTPHSPVRGPYDIILLDPPYGDPHLKDILERLALSPLVGGHTMVVVEHSKRVTLPESVGGRLVLMKTRCHGDTCVSMYRSIPQEEGPE
jgi:16S rRNA (guanine966-N2)-methyltransferase